MHSVWDKQVQDVLEEAKSMALSKSSQKVVVDGKRKVIPRPFPSPEDWRDAWIYFMMVDRFCNPKEPPQHEPWDGAWGTFQGGSIQGVQAQLPYLAELGVKAIWLSPIFKNRISDDFGYHGYGIQDFLNVDPRFGNEKDLRNLVDEAHARGMYIILDIVLNHTGDVFAYRVYHSEPTLESEAPWNDGVYNINWRDEQGVPRSDWEDAPKTCSHDAAVWPTEFRENQFFRRQGKGGEAGGDFCSLKELVTEREEFSPRHGHYFPVRDTLIRAHQYWIAKADIDGYRIDTLKYVKPEFARIFGNAMREFAVSIGKKNFFTFGEVWDNEEKIAKFIGRETSESGQLIGVDAALDFPLFSELQSVVKGFMPPAKIVEMFQHRREVQRGVLSSRGEAGRYFVTFLDNHDQKERFYYSNQGDHKYDAQVALGIGCLFSLQGIPCLYYGTEQGLHGRGGSDSYVREALWGKPNAFDRNHSFYATIKELSAVRESQPALRYGRQYFRPISGNGQEFGISTFPQGVLAFSRILNDTEIVVILNTHTTQPWQGEVIVDFALNPVGTNCGVLFSNRGTQAPGQVREKPAGAVTIHETDGTTSYGPVRTLPVVLKPMEIQILRK